MTLTRRSSTAERTVWMLVAVVMLFPAWARADEVDDRVERLNELLKDIPTVVAERRADQTVVTGWTRDAQSRKMLDRILATEKPVLDLTGEDVADANRMVEIDVTIVVVYDTISRSVGFDFLNLVNMQFNYFRSFHLNDGYGFQTPGREGNVDAGTQRGRLFNAKVDYSVNIANASDRLVNIIARPHLTTLNGQKAEFLAGGEIVFKVSGLQSGRIQPYPYGIQVNVTPTVLRTPGPNGETQVLLDVDAQRLTVLGVELVSASAGSDDVSFDKVQVKSKAVLPINETLILSGLYQRERREQRTGVPLLRDIPFIKYFFSNRSTVDEILSTMIFLTPREPSSLTQATVAELDTFVQRRGRYIEARQKGGAVSERFRDDFSTGGMSDWYKPQPNRYASHFYLLNNSKIYRELRGEDLRSESIRRDLMSVERTGTIGGMR